MKSLNIFFNPKSIAIIGASQDPKKVGGILMKKSFASKSKIIPINIKKSPIFGLQSYTSVLEYKRKIDLAIIAIPSKFVLKVLTECGKKKIKNVIIISSGFAEKGNKDLEKHLISVAKRYKINLLGPNCFGITNTLVNLDLTFANKTALKGNTAFISQSGAMASYLFDLKDFKCSGFVSLGNMAGLDFADWIKFFNKDKHTKQILLYIEKIKDGKKFLKVCKKSKKKIIAIKVGCTDEGSKAAISHTASLATDFEIYKGAFRQAGVKLIEEPFSNFTFPKKLNQKQKITIITNAGGAGALMADALVKKGFTLSQSPIDILGTASAQDYKKALNKFQKTKNLILVILTPQTMSEPDETAQEIVKFSRKNKNIVACFLGERSMHKANLILKNGKIQIFEDIHKLF